MMLYKLNVSENFFDGDRIRPITFIKNVLDFYKYVCMAEIEKMVAEDKVVIFPISTTYYTDAVKSYLELGFTPYFVRVKDYKKIINGICKLQSTEVKYE